MADAYFLPLAESGSTLIVSVQVDRPDVIHLQDNHFISPLYDFQFTELYRDDAIGPMAESILQHALCAKQAGEKKKRSKLKS
jgi:hypothetical protein